MRGRTTYTTQNKGTTQLAERRKALPVGLLGC